MVGSSTSVTSERSRRRELLNLPAERVRQALHDYGMYLGEIDAEVAMADQESRTAKEA